jgi:lipopolysaccharide transport system ATP-binding protein
VGDIAIRVQHISKQYRIEENRRPPDTLRDHLMQMLSNVFTPTRHTAKDMIWALKDVSLEVKHGEVLGIIGHNGAGKSTLLKILSNITTPSGGRVELYGRVGSLLEVGTGFHGELTGRENIYLSGAIQGMKKKEIVRKFDEIVAYSEIHPKFLDTPVKRYSSGMYVRLAFAVAAHLELEILLVDEVLAVGDAAFQKKCLGKMEDVAKAGRTVLLVSHNVSSIIQLCPRAILLEKGRIVSAGNSREIVERYLSEAFSQEHADKVNSSVLRSEAPRLRLMRTYLRTQTGASTTTPIAGLPIDIVMEFESHEDLIHVQFMLTIFNQKMVPVTHCNVHASGAAFCVPRGKGHAVCHIPKLPLPRGAYKVSVAATDERGDLDLVPSACFFNVEASTFFPTTFAPPTEYCTTLVEQSWKLERQEDEAQARLALDIQKPQDRSRVQSVQE